MQYKLKPLSLSGIVFVCILPYLFHPSLSLSMYLSLPSSYLYFTWQEEQMLTDKVANNLTVAILHHNIKSTTNILAYMHFEHFNSSIFQPAHTTFRLSVLMLQLPLKH